MYCYNKNISFNRVAVKRLYNCLQIVSTLYRGSNKICHKQSSFVVFLKVVYQFQFISIALVTTRNQSGRRSTPARLCLLWGQFAGVLSSEGVPVAQTNLAGALLPQFLKQFLVSYFTIAGRLLAVTVSRTTGMNVSRCC